MDRGTIQRDVPGHMDIYFLFAHTIRSSFLGIPCMLVAMQLGIISRFSAPIRCAKMTDSHDIKLCGFVLLVDEMSFIVVNTG